MDTAFHLAISTASGNDIAEEIISHILPAFTEGYKAVLYLSHGGPKIIREHLRIIEALESHNTVAAEKAMREHIRGFGRISWQLITPQNKTRNKR